MSSSNIPSEVAAIISGRRTIHEFTDQIPPEDVVLQAIDLARWAPNHRATEPWRFHWLGPQASQAIVELNAQMVLAKSGAEAAETKRRQWSTVPLWLVVTSTNDPDEFTRQEDYAATCCAVQNLAIALWSAGIGMKWTTGKVTRHPDFFAATNIDATQRTVVGMMWLGYPKSVPTQTRKPLDEILLRVP